jgi:predicted nucleotidyltransferase
MKSQLLNSENIPSKKELQQFIQDINNTSFHESIISDAVGVSRKIPAVEAVFLLGSLSEGKGDIFSDIDFYLMIKDDQNYNNILETFLSDIDKLGDVIHIFRSNAKKNSIIIYLKPYIKFELVVETFSTLCDEWRVGERGSLLYDKNGMGKEALSIAKKLEFNMGRHLDEIRNMALDLPSFCFLIAGYMMRGEHVTIIDFIAWIRRKMLRISGFLLGMRDEGTRRAEQRFPEDLIRYYERCKVKAMEDVWDCLMVFLEWYSDWMVPKFEEHEIIHAGQEVQVIKSAINQLRKRF